MKPPEEAKRDLVRQWVRKAENDLTLAQYLVEEGCTYREAIGFNAQQAAEKYLKALLVLHQVEFPKTHNLGELLDRLSAVDPVLAGGLREVTSLNPYGVEYHYPGDFPELTEEDARTALMLALKVRDAVMPTVSPYLAISKPEP